MDENDSAIHLPDPFEAFNPLTTNDDYSRHQNSATLSVGAIRFENTICANRKGGTRGGG